MLRLFGLLVCLVTLVTCRSIYDPYRGGNHYNDNNFRYMNQQRRYTHNDWEQPSGNYWSINQGNDQGINDQSISDLQGRQAQLESDLQGMEDQRISDLRGQQDQFLSDLGRSDSDPRFTQNRGYGNWW